MVHGTLFMKLSTRALHAYTHTHLRTVQVPFCPEEYSLLTPNTRSVAALAEGGLFENTPDNWWPYKKTFCKSASHGKRERSVPPPPLVQDTCTVPCFKRGTFKISQVRDAGSFFVSMWQKNFRLGTALYDGILEMCVGEIGQILKEFFCRMFS